MMTANEYQVKAARTLIDEPDKPFTDEELAIMFAALELGARVGAALDYVKKSICHRHGFDPRELHRLLCDMAVADIDLRVTSVGAHNHQTYQLSGTDQMLLWCAIGLGGEAGEVMDVISALAVSGLPVDRIALTKELGDNDWYNAALCTLVGVSMSEVMENNIAKLIQRYPNGYASADSVSRVDVTR